MLRALVLLLLLANLLFFAWAQGWLVGVVAIDPRGGREPQRLQEQIEPESIRILRSAPLATPPAAPPASAPSAASQAAAASQP